MIGVGLLLVVIVQMMVMYIYIDVFGWVVVESDVNGNVIKCYDYEFYGFVVGGQVMDGFGYIGQVSDLVIGLSYMWQLYMDFQLGVFLLVDLVMVYLKLVGQFNWYRYVNGNLYKFIDFDGW